MALDTVAQLHDVPLFSGLSRVDLAKLLPELEDRHLEPNELLFRRGDEGDALYIIRSGRIEIEVEGDDGGEVVRLAVLGPGDSLGEFALLTGEPRNATARALEPVDLWRLGKERFDSLVAHNPHVALFLTRLLVRRLMDTDAELAEARQQLALQTAARFERLPPEVQAFALRSCVLDRVRPRILGRLRGGEACEEWLRLLQLEGLAHRDDSTGCWRFPPHFREFLESRIEQTAGAERLRQLRLELADHHERAGDWAAALEMYLQCQGWASAGWVLTRHGEELAREQPRAFVDWFERLVEHGWQPDLDIALLAAEAARRIDDTRAAIRCLQGVLESKAVEADRERTADICRQIAELYLKQGDAAEAVAYMRLSAESAGLPDQSGAAAYQDTMVGQFLKRGRADEALRWARAALRSGRDVRESSLLQTWFGPRTTRWLGAGLAVALPAALWLMPPPGSFSAAGWHLLALLTGAAVLWLFNVVPDFIVAVSLVVLCVLFGLSDSSTAMAGYGSETYFITLGVLALGAGMMRTGLLYRLSLHMLRRFPPTYFGQVVALALSGVLVTPAIPLGIGRIAIASPLALTISDALKLGDRSKGSTGLAMAALLGFSTMFFPFFNGPGALLIFGLFPPEAQAGVDFVTWFLWSLPAAVVVLAGSLVAIKLLYPARAGGRVSPETIQRQLELLGPVTFQERLMVAVTAVALVVFIAQPFGLSPAWVMLLLVGVMVVGQALDRNTLRGGLDWPLLLYQGAMLGLAGVAARTGLNGAMGDLLLPLTEGSLDNAYLLLGALVLGVYAIRFVLPAGPTVVLLLLSLIPLAPALSIHPFVFGLVVQIASNIWLIPQQNLVYLAVYSGTEERAFTHAEARPYAFAHAGLTLLATLASVPFWQTLGLVR